MGIRFLHITVIRVCGESMFMFRFSGYYTTWTFLCHPITENLPQHHQLCVFITSLILHPIILCSESWNHSSCWPVDPNGGGFAGWGVDAAWSVLSSALNFSVADRKIKHFSMNQLVSEKIWENMCYYHKVVVRKGRLTLNYSQFFISFSLFCPLDAAHIRSMTHFCVNCL